MAEQQTKLLCEEKHKHIDSKLTEHDNRLNIHGDRLDKLENGATRTEVVVEQLCSKIDKMVNILVTAFIGMLGTLVGFVIWYIQQPR